MTSDGGIEFLLDLPQAAHLHDGDCGCSSTTAGSILVRAAAEPVLDIQAGRT